MLTSSTKNFFPLEKKSENIIKEIKSEKLKLIILETIPDFIENLEILNYIGSGSESEVYKVLIKENNKFVAIKFIFVLEDKKVNTSEINISNKLKHKNIINFYFCGEIKKEVLYCMVMDHGRFGHMFTFMNKYLHQRVLSESFLCFFSYQILEGIKYCHKNKICHMDIKPQNIVIDEHLTPKLIDFSISLDYSLYCIDGKIKLPFKGTSLFMAPEIITQNYVAVKDINKVDLYSFGVTIFLLGFGYYPFDLNPDDVRKYNIINKKINSGLKINNNIRRFSPGFIDFLEKLLVYDINQRMNIDQALNHYWIKGANILLEEKENIYNGHNFFVYMLLDHFYSFKEYLKNF